MISSVLIATARNSLKGQVHANLGATWWDAAQAVGTVGATFVAVLLA